MENIYNNYRNVIERAVFAGIITEESKKLYLSAIREENDSDLSELETRLNMEEATDSDFRHNKKNENVERLKSTNNENNNNEVKKMEMRPFNNDDCQSSVSEDTIENYSILDIKNSKDKDDFTENTDSDVSSIMQQNASSMSTKRLESARHLSKVVKKPIKNQILDFNIPVYTGRKKKKCMSKPHAIHSEDSTHYEMSNTCTCKSSSSKLEENVKTQCATKWTLPKSKTSVISRQRSLPPPYMKTFMDSNTFTNQSDKPTTELNASSCENADKSVKTNLVHTCSLQKKASEFHKENPAIVSKHLEAESNTNACHCTNKKHASNSLRLKFNKDLVNQEQKYKIKLKSSVDSDAHQYSCNKNGFKRQMYVSKKTDKCKHCKRNCACKSIQSVLSAANVTETASEDGISVLDVTTTKNSHDKECDRLVNVNIICQFYQDDENKKQTVTQDPQPANDIPETPAENIVTEVPIVPEVQVTENEKAKQSNEVHVTENEKAKQSNEVHVTENEKAKQSNKTHRLSKLFGNMKIKRKKKPPE